VKRYKFSSLNNEKDKVIDNNIEMKEPLTQKPAKETFVNKNKNILRTSIFSNHAQFGMRKLRSSKNNSLHSGDIKANKYNEIYKNNSNLNNDNDVNNNKVINYHINNKKQKDLIDENNLEIENHQEELKRDSSNDTFVYNKLNFVFENKIKKDE
jgi:hypothetical protein